MKSKGLLVVCAAILLLVSCGSPRQWSVGTVSEVRITVLKPLASQPPHPSSADVAIGAGVGAVLAGPVGAVVGAIVGDSGPSQVTVSSGQDIACAFRLTSPIGERVFRLTTGPTGWGDVDAQKCSTLRDGDQLPCFKTPGGIAFRWVKD